MRILLPFLFLLSASCSHVGFYKHEDGVKLFTKLKTCIDSYHSKKKEQNLELNEKLIPTLGRCIKPFVEVKKRYLNKLAWRLTTVDFLSKPKKCTKDKIEENLRYKEKKPAVSLCIDLKDKLRDRKAIIFFQEIKYKLKYTDIRY